MNTQKWWAFFWKLAGWWFQIFSEFSPLFGEDFQFDEHFFKGVESWNHQPAGYFMLFQYMYLEPDWPSSLLNVCYIIGGFRYLDSWPWKKMVEKNHHPNPSTSNQFQWSSREQSHGFSKWYGCFQKWWYPQIIHFNRVFHYKPSILGYPYFWKHPYIPLFQYQEWRTKIGDPPSQTMAIFATHYGLPFTPWVMPWKTSDLQWFRQFVSKMPSSTPTPTPFFEQYRPQT